MALGKHQLIWSEATPRGAAPERSLVKRVVSSQCFEKSTRLRDFLVYVCERALNDPQAEIREQDIGCAVFGRPADYDTNQDNIVRVNASHLRKKLDTYFATEGQLEQLILTLPKGQYSPAFTQRQDVAESGRPLESLPQPAGASSSRQTHFLIGLSVALALFCAGLVVALISRTGSPAVPAEMLPWKALWGSLMVTGQPTEIVLADSSLGLTQDVIGEDLPLSEYIRPNIWMQAQGLASRPDAQMAARFAARRRYTDMASVNAAFRILALAGLPERHRVTLHFAREFNLQRMKSANAILLGSHRTNPWVEMVENRMTFRFGFDKATRQAYFENPHPLPGELPVYANSSSTSYCQITFLPNLGGKGNLLVISGTDPEGTETGAEFLTTEAGLATLSRRLPGRQTGPLPYFEVILKSARVGGAASGCEIAAARTIAPGAVGRGNPSREPAPR